MNLYHQKTTALKEVHRKALRNVFDLCFRPFSAFWGWLISEDIPTTTFRNKHPVKYMVYSFICTIILNPYECISSMLEKTYYWYAYRFMKEHRYNIVKTGLQPGYYDVDARMIHACFSLLVGFVEGEHLCMHCNEKDIKDILKIKDPIVITTLLDNDISQREKSQHKNQLYGFTNDAINNLKELRNLYYWWKIDRPLIHKAFEEGDYKNIVVEKRYNHEFSEHTAFDIEMLIDAEDDAMLVRLMNIRRTLWT